MKLSTKLRRIADELEKGNLKVVYDTWSASDREKMENLLDEVGVKHTNVGSKVTAYYNDDLERAMEESKMHSDKIHFEKE